LGREIKPGANIDDLVYQTWGSHKNHRLRRMETIPEVIRMKQPKINAIEIDLAGTKDLRAKLRKTKNIKLTIKIDSGSFDSLSKFRGKKLPSYYQIIGQLLKTKLDDTAVSRLNRVERELKKLKRQIAA
jgi:hypothetical protein